MPDETGMTGKNVFNRPSTKEEIATFLAGCGNQFTRFSLPPARDNAPTPLQAIAAQIKALSWTDMEELCVTLDGAFRGHAESVKPFELLAAADALAHRP